MLAACEAFESEGPDVPLEEVARRAGVGASTLYRRFRGRDDLLAAVFAHLFEEDLEPILKRAEAEPDPAAGLLAVLDGMARAVIDRPEIFRLAATRAEFPAKTLTRVDGALRQLLDRARAAGVVRDDVVVDDLPVLAMMIATADVQVGRHADSGPRREERWLRYLALVLDALAPGARRDPLPPVPVRLPAQEPPEL